MKRMIICAAVAAAAALAAAPASADPTIERCGITPRIPCGVCLDAETCVGRGSLG